MRSYGPLVYPGNRVAPLRSVVLSERFTQIYDQRSYAALGRRVPVSFDSDIQLLIKITSRIAEARGWIRAGIVAQVYDLSVEKPKGIVERVYVDKRLFVVNSNDASFYLEFWPHVWLSDYRLELWARLA